MIAAALQAFLEQEQALCSMSQQHTEEHSFPSVNAAQH